MDPLPWHADPGFWTSLREGIFDPEAWAMAADEVELLLRLAPVGPRACVLDMPCGPGRHLLPLAARGLSVCGVDLIAAHLDEARQRAAREGLALELIQADMHGFVRPSGFDLALNLYTSFGYAADPTDDRRMLENLRRSLKPGGRLVMELVTRENARAGEPVRHELGHGRWIVEQASLEHGGSAIQRRWELHGPEPRSWTAWHRLYRAEDLRQLLRASGFGSSELFGELDGSPFSASSACAVLVAHA